MLQVDIDTQDVLVKSPGLSIIDPASSFSPVIQAAGATSPYFIPPSGNALILRPLQLLPGWPEAVKFRSGDYSSPAGWEEQQVRASGDWFMHSTGPVTPLSLAYTFPANTGWFIEFRAYAIPKSLPEPIFDFAFGQYFQIIIGSDGRMDLYDKRIGTSVPCGSGNIANFNSFVNEDVQLLVLPFRRQQLLVWSPNRGGYIDAAVTIGKDGNITEPGAATMYSSVAPPAALVAITPLLYPADGIEPIFAPQKALTTPLTQTPSFAGSEFDQPGSSICTLTVDTPYVSSPPVREFVYSVTMAGNTAHQTAEEQGIAGIGASSGNVSGDAVFSGGEYPYSLYTPLLYLTVIGYPRVIGPTTFATVTLTGILKAKLRLSRDRSSKSFTFTVDNPAIITGLGANYTALKDQQNRRCKAYLTNPALEAGASDAEIAADPDPDTPLIVAYGYKQVYIFDGFTDQPEFVDGAESQVQIRCQGLWKRLRSYIFCDTPYYDGDLVTNVVTDVLTRCGFVGPADAVSGMGLEIVCETSTDRLPTAAPGDEPLFTPAIGSTAEEFLQLIANYTGWLLDDLIDVGSSNAAWYWTSQDYYAESVYAAQGSPDVSRTSVYNAGFGVGLPDSWQPNQGLGSLAMLGRPAPKQSLEELLANELFVLGTDDRGQAILAYARDEASISDSTAINYVGETRTFILISQWINTQAAANQVCAILYGNMTQARTHLTFTLPDFYPRLGISAPLTLAGYWNGAIDGIEADLGQLRYRRTQLSVLRTS
jgi:hypothetical protein